MRLRSWTLFAALTALTASTGADQLDSLRDAWRTEHPDTIIELRERVTRTDNHSQFQADYMMATAQCSSSDQQRQRAGLALLRQLPDTYRDLELVEIGVVYTAVRQCRDVINGKVRLGKNLPRNQVWIDPGTPLDDDANQTQTASHSGKEKTPTRPGEPMTGSTPRLEFDEQDGAPSGSEINDNGEAGLSEQEGGDNGVDDQEEGGSRETETTPYRTARMGSDSLQDEDDSDCDGPCGEGPIAKLDAQFIPGTSTGPHGTKAMLKAVMKAKGYSDADEALSHLGRAVQIYGLDNVLSEYDRPATSHGTHAIDSRTFKGSAVPMDFTRDDISTKLEAPSAGVAGGKMMPDLEGLPEDGLTVPASEKGLGMGSIDPIEKAPVLAPRTRLELEMPSFDKAPSMKSLGIESRGSYKVIPKVQMPRDIGIRK